MKRPNHNPFSTLSSFIVLVLFALVFQGCPDLIPTEPPLPPSAAVDHEVGQSKGGDASFDESESLQAHLDYFDVNYDQDVLDPNSSDSVLVYKNEYVVRWAPNVPDNYKDSVRNQNDKEYRIAWYPCMCANMIVELWITGSPIPTNERENSKSSSNGKIEEFDPNVIFGTQFFKGDMSLLTPIDMTTIPLVHSGNPDATKIAILDTGFDFDNAEYGNLMGGFNLQTNSAEIGGVPNADDDSNCLPDDMGGWDFVNNDNRAEDDHSHGTHVTSLLVQEVMGLDPTAPFVVLPLKTHNELGNASLYTLACAIDYAISKSVDFVNGSWGYDGPPAGVLDRALNDLKTSGAVFVGSSGNGAKDLATDPHQPSMRYYENKSGTLSINADSNSVSKLWEHSNYHSGSPFIPNLSAPGVDQMGFVPDELLGLAGSTIKMKSGTSMAAPRVIGGMVIAHQAGMVAIDIPQWFIANCFRPYPAGMGFDIRMYDRTLVLPAVGGI